MHTITVSDDTFARLSHKAQRLGVRIDEVLDRLIGPEEPVDLSEQEIPRSVADLTPEERVALMTEFESRQKPRNGNADFSRDAIYD